MAPKGADNFRQRRLSLTDVDTSEFAGNSSSPQPNRGRRLSLSPEMGAKNVPAAPFPMAMVGTFSCHGVEPGQRQGEAKAKINQDRGAIVYPFTQANDKALFCVFDGHGANGDKVSQYSAEKIPEKLEEKLNAGMAEAKALMETFVEVDNMLKKDKSIDAELSGTTAVVVLYQFISPGKAKMWAANAGDSRCVMFRNGKAVDVTEDQKPNTPAEQARITKAGGYVSPPEEEWGGPARVWLDANMTLPGLAMARSIGDHLVKAVGVTAEPVVTEFDVNAIEGQDDYIVMASDGVWEFIESDMAVDILKKAGPASGGDSSKQVQKLIETAAAKWRQEEGDYRDDITATLVKLPQIDAQFHKK